MYGAHCGDGEQRVGAVTGWKWRQRVLNGKDNRSSGGRIIAKPGTKAEAGLGAGGRALRGRDDGCVRIVIRDARTWVPSVSSAVRVGLRAVENDICWGFAL